MTTRSKPSKQIGRTVSNLIQIARSLKSEEATPKQAVAAPREKDMHTEADRIKYWRGIARKQADLVRAKEIEIEVLKRMKVQNLSLAEIERELVRREKMKAQQNQSPGAWPK